MDIFDIHDEVLDRYGEYVQSFLSIADDDIRAFVAQEILGASTRCGRMRCYSLTPPMRRLPQ